MNQEKIPKIRKSEEKLKESEALFLSAFYSNSNLMAISEIENGTFLEVNNAFLETIQTTREEIIGKSAEELYDDQNDRDTIIRLLRENGKVINFELKFKTSKGDSRIGLFSFDIVKEKLLPGIAGKGGGSHPLWKGVGMDISGVDGFLENFRYLVHSVL